MNTFTLELNDTSRAERIEGVVSFVAEDGSGSFGLQAGHERFMTVLRFGLARWRAADGDWHYIAMPGGALYFNANRLWIGTRRFLLDDDYSRISRLLREQLLAEEQALRETSQSLRRMEEELLRRLTELGAEAE